VVLIALSCFTSTLGNMTTLVRTVYGLAIDGLLPSYLAKVQSKTQIPHWATVTITAGSALLSVCFSFEQLMQMVGGGVLMNFTIVAITLIIISYRTSSVTEETPFKDCEGGSKGNARVNSSVMLLSLLYLIIVSTTLMFLIKVNMSMTHNIILSVLGLGAGFAVLMWIWLGFVKDENKEQSFKCPLVPFVPGLAVVLNTMLLASLEDGMLLLQMMGVYLVGAVVVYMGYGIFFSKITRDKQGEEHVKRFDMMQPTCPVAEMLGK